MSYRAKDRLQKRSTTRIRNVHSIILVLQLLIITRVTTWCSIVRTECKWSLLRQRSPCKASRKLKLGQEHITTKWKILNNTKQTYLNQYTKEVKQKDKESTESWTERWSRNDCFPWLQTMKTKSTAQKKGAFCYISGSFQDFSTWTRLIK